MKKNNKEVSGPSKGLYSFKTSKIKYTILGFFLIIFTMAIIFNFKIELVYSHVKEADGSYQKANIFLWPIQQFFELLVFKWFKLGEASRAGGFLWFFLMDTSYILLLLSIFSFLFNLARKITPEKELNYWLRKKDGFVGRIIGAFVGFATPFCSCSTIPITTSLLKAKTPFGTIVSFLVVSPMINEAGLAIMWSLFGYKVTLLYVLFGFIIGISASYIATRMKLNSQIKIVDDEEEEKAATSLKKTLIVKDTKINWKIISKKSLYLAREAVKKIWKILIFAMIIAALMHSYIPEGWIKEHIGNAWWAPLALVPFGIMLYLNISATLPIAGDLIKSGLNVGSALGFMMAVNTISLPEMILLSKIFKRKFMIFYITFLLIAILIFSYILMFIPSAVLLH